MIDIEVHRTRHGRTIKLYGRVTDQPPVTATVRLNDIHIYSHATMSHAEWIQFSAQVESAIDEMKRRNEKINDADNPS